MFGRVKPYRMFFASGKEYITICKKCKHFTVTGSSYETRRYTQKLIEMGYKQQRCKHLKRF
jgi:hypothetical protein